MLSAVLHQSGEQQRSSSSKGDQFVADSQVQLPMMAGCVAIYGGEDNDANIEEINLTALKDCRDSNSQMFLLSDMM